MARVKRAMMTRKRRNRTLKLGQGLLGIQIQALQDGQTGRHEVRRLRLCRPPDEEARLPSALDHPDQRRLQGQRHELFHLHARPEAGPMCRSTGRCSPSWPSTTRPPSPSSPSWPRPSWPEPELYPRDAKDRWTSSIGLFYGFSFINPVQPSSQNSVKPRER